MYEQVCIRYEVVPANYLADGGFSKKDPVTALEQNGTKFYGPLHNERKELLEGKDPYQPRARENSYYTNFRKRMGEDDAKTIYRRRSAAAEFPNAVCVITGSINFVFAGY